MQFVDDEVKFLSTLSERLGLKDFDVNTATNGKDAIKLARKGNFDVAIVDEEGNQLAPGQTGLLAVRRQQYL